MNYHLSRVVGLELQEPWLEVPDLQETADPEVDQVNKDDVNKNLSVRHKNLSSNNVLHKNLSSNNVHHKKNLNNSVHKTINSENVLKTINSGNVLCKKLRKDLARLRGKDNKTQEDSGNKDGDSKIMAEGDREVGKRILIEVGIEDGVEIMEEMEGGILEGGMGTTTTTEETRS